MVSVNLPMKLYIVLLLCSPIVINTEQETRTPANMVILAGVMKAGTTSLWEAMLQHPNIHSGLVAKGMRGTDKELHFFDTQTVCHNGNVLQRGRGNASVLLQSLVHYRLKPLQHRLGICISVNCQVFHRATKSWMLPLSTFQCQNRQCPHGTL
eukprot:m.227224 g.227224  ORF g.227224 m.227224 type:complete len:153 (-) comp15970_c1_seq17:3794-4252(-)